MATTIARTPSPSANAAPRMNWARIAGGASGLRPIAVAASPVRMPIPMPGPITPSAARPAPRGPSSMSASPPGRPAWADADSMTLSVGGLGPRNGWADVPFRDVLFAGAGMLVAVGLDRNDRVHQHQRREDQRLHEVEQSF